jgi:lipopolysaccharide biosynthesis protein
MTPFELNIVITARADRMKQEQEDRIVAAYLSAYWQRVKKLPSLKSILEENKPKKPQTVEDMLEEIKRLNAAMGGTVY